MSLAVAQDPAQEERLLKAAYIYNFGKFTRWPEGILQSAQTPLRLCIAGRDELVEELERLEGKTIGGHPLTIRSFRDIQEDNGACQILYIARSKQKRAVEIVASLRGEPVLTVSELPGFARSGGIIELFRENDRLRFIINLAVAREAGLVLSARLLSLAVVVGQEDAQ